MVKNKRIVVIMTVFSVLFNSNLIFAAPADVSQGDFTISGSVPEIFSLQVRGVPGDLDLSPNVVVNDRLLALIHLKYNLPLASLVIKSDSATGLPTLNGAGVTAAPFATAMSLSVTGCTTVDAAAGAAITPANLGAGTWDIKTTVAGFFGAGFTAGLEEECSVTASWVGTATAIPLAGKYSMTVTVVMTST